jgi:exodeoxyribonuclease VII small subunit
MERTMAGVKFEQAMARLEAIVGELEKGDLPLDESLKIFEEGIRLSKSCLKVLEEAERKVEVLVQEKNGKKSLRAFSLEEDTEGPSAAS